MCRRNLSLIIASLESHHTSGTHCSWLRFQRFKRQKSIIFSGNIKCITKLYTIYTSDWIYRLCKIEFVKLISRLDYQKNFFVEGIHFYLHNIIAPFIRQSCVPERLVYLYFVFAVPGLGLWSWNGEWPIFFALKISVCFVHY